MQLGPLQQAWVDALRSGKYKQGIKRLKDGDEHCCLGVLCELAVDAGVTTRVGTNTDVCGYGSWIVDTNFPPGEVREWVGLKSSSGYIVGAASLVDYNDRGHSFEQIATIIEENADALFERPM